MEGLRGGRGWRGSGRVERGKGVREQGCEMEVKGRRKEGEKGGAPPFPPAAPSSALDPFLFLKI